MHGPCSPQSPAWRAGRLCLASSAGCSPKSRHTRMHACRRQRVVRGRYSVVVRVRLRVQEQGGMPQRQCWPPTWANDADWRRPHTARNAQRHTHTHTHTHTEHTRKPWFKVVAAKRRTHHPPHAPNASATHRTPQRRARATHNSTHLEAPVPVVAECVRVYRAIHVERRARDVGGRVCCVRGLGHGLGRG
jgi:hypothetical protein